MKTINRLLFSALVCVAVATAVSCAATSRSASTESIEPLMILPQPKSFIPADGTFPLTDETPLILPENMSEPERLAASAFVYWCEDTFGVSPKVQNTGTPPVILEIRNDPVTEGPAKDGYVLSISPEEVRVTGNSDSGLYYGIVTLTQIAQQQSKPLLPCLTMTDEPDFEFRGFYHDVTRGKVPTLDTLKRIADYLADHKANQLQLYVEHTFAFSFDPEIAQNPDGLTAEEIRELDRYCADRHIDLVPSLQAFGHMAGVLSLPQYRHLADVELEGEWSDLTWYQRMKGATIDVSNPEALALLERMLGEFLPLFDSQYVNVCADETYDLGKGKTAGLAEEMGKGRLYLQHIAWLNEVCKSHGKRMMFWGDIVKQHEDLIPEIPTDTILLNWGYRYNSDFDSCALFREAGVDFYVCPGTSGWNEILNRIDNAELNIRRYIDAGRKYGAMGVLNTDWGDHGHYNLLAGSWHGAALGAALSWNGATDQQTFDRFWSRRMFNVDSTKPADLLRATAFDRETYGSWRTFYQPFSEYKHVEKKTDEYAGQLKEQSEKSVEYFESLGANNQGDATDLAEYVHMCRMMGLCGEKIQLVRAVHETGDATNPGLAQRFEVFAIELESLYDEYEELWRARNKESELGDIRTAIENLIIEAQTLSSKYG